MIHGIETRSDDGELKALFGWMEQHSCCGVSTRSTCWLSRQQQQTVPRLLIRSFGGFYFTTGTGSGWEKRRRRPEESIQDVVGCLLASKTSKNGRSNVGLMMMIDPHLSRRISSPSSLPPSNNNNNHTDRQFVQQLQTINSFDFFINLILAPSR